jgi:hypothetical protein
METPFGWACELGFVKRFRIAVQIRKIEENIRCSGVATTEMTPSGETSFRKQTLKSKRTGYRTAHLSFYGLTIYATPAK